MLLSQLQQMVLDTKQTDNLTLYGPAACIIRIIHTIVIHVIGCKILSDSTKTLLYDTSGVMRLTVTFVTRVPQYYAKWF